MNKKICKFCNLEKDVEDFHKSSRSVDGDTGLSAEFVQILNEVILIVRSKMKVTFQHM